MFGLIELLLTLMEIMGVVLDALTGICIVADIISFVKGKPNRSERKSAKEKGAKLPKRDKWGKLFVLITTFICFLISLMVIRWLWK